MASVKEAGIEMAQQYRKMEKIEISVQELTVGMFVSELDRPWSETPFLFQGFSITEEQQISELKKYCETVFIDISKNKQMPSSHLSVVLEQTSKPKAPTQISFNREMATADKIFRGSKDQIKELALLLKDNGNVNIEAAHCLVENCLKSLSRNENTLTWLTQIKT